MKIVFPSFLLVTLFSLALPAYSQTCDSITRNIAMRSTDATASIWANWRESDGSVKRESLRMFEEAKEKAPGLIRPEEICQGRCALAAWPSMIFSSVPRKFKRDYSEEEKCGGLLAETSAKPLRYSKSLPRNIEALSSWVGEFSQGEGELGEDLYKRCDGSCSPQYHYLITVHPESLAVTADVICGHARDKDDNHYTLSYSYRWECRDRVVPGSP